MGLEMGILGAELRAMAGGEEGFESNGRKPNPVDIHVGSRVRLRRLVIGMSQEKLGEKMSLTFQQIQKYEKGTNRIGASRLFQLSQILDVPMSFFFEDAPVRPGAQQQAGFAEAKTETFLMDFLNTREGLELNRAFVKVSDAKIRRKIIDLVRSLSDEASEALADAGQPLKPND
ncbi:MAG: helix-turn-helix transcriptional regulator [Chitinophagales bacterium]|nr:helix-turn-helix transcriptional regulator [Hyphomicrobiales bacterium]